ncbi:hypothetical protein SIID45300_00684 [Candidatus Magnetaquicoccaceae bacterium FCR-1]|uniref:Uncharacterized protein n=1 Tax=Candidatus Magnetaquiglobus chichijimensis TaxID=3141448 RepID=A0ABQ0C664_9PROT
MSGRIPCPRGGLEIAKQPMRVMDGPPDCAAIRFGPVLGIRTGRVW